MQDMKFHVTSPEQSERLQKVLFELGYSWSSGSNTQYTDYPYIFVFENNITYDISQQWFEEKPFREQDVEKFIAQNSSKTSTIADNLIETDTVKPPIELVSVLGSLYEKNALKAVLSKLQTYSIND